MHHYIKKFTFFFFFFFFNSSPLEDENALPIVENVMMVSDQSESRENSQSELQKNSPPVRVKRVIDSDSEG